MTALEAAEAEVESVITAILRGDHDTALEVASSMTHPDMGVVIAGDVVTWALRALSELGDGPAPEDLWAAWLLYKAAGFPDDEEADQ